MFKKIVLVAATVCLSSVAFAQMDNDNTAAPVDQNAPAQMTAPAAVTPDQTAPAAVAAPAPADNNAAPAPTTDGANNTPAPPTDTDNGNYDNQADY